jgi:hypothetical protein
LVDSTPDELVNTTARSAWANTLYVNANVVVEAFPAKGPAFIASVDIVTLSLHANKTSFQPEYSYLHSI